MNDRQRELEQLDRGWKIIQVIWWAILASLPMYLVVCILVEKELHINIDSNFPLDTIRYTFFAVSVITLFAVHFLRRFLLDTGRSAVKPDQSQSPQQAAVGKYTIATIITSTLL